MTNTCSLLFVSCFYVTVDIYMFSITWSLVISQDITDHFMVMLGLLSVKDDTLIYVVVYSNYWSCYVVFSAKCIVASRSQTCTQVSVMYWLLQPGYQSKGLRKSLCCFISMIWGAYSHCQSTQDWCQSTQDWGYLFF